MAPRLVFLTGSKAGTGLTLDAETVSLGRHADRTVAFSPDELLVSSEHATLRLRDGRYVLTDEGSTNGTFVNGELSFERTLEDGDVIQFGAGGPTAQFLDAAAGQPTFDVVGKLARRTQPAMVTPVRLPGGRGTREVVALTLQRFTTRTRRLLLGLGVVGVAGLSATFFWQQSSKSRLERALSELSVAFASERASRATLAQDLGAARSRYDSLRGLVAAEQRREAESRQAALGALREYSQSVALIVFSYGYVEPGGSALLRHVVDRNGEITGTWGPDGSFLPALRFGGTGPAVVQEGSATGFLIDSTGLLLTNRHVAEPWAYEERLGMLRAHGLDATGRLLQLRAIFPPGDQVFPLAIESKSDHADLAVLRLVGGPVHARPLPLAPARSSVTPGDRLRLVGYPTGVHNLLFRVDEAERQEILELVGDDARKLVDELARRRLIHPLVTEGTVSDTTGFEVIHTAASTVGGSGGPLLDERQMVIGVQHASVSAPGRGDPFRTQRGVPIRFAWEILPKAR